MEQVATVVSVDGRQGLVKDTVTLGLGGEVPLNLYAQGMQHLARLIQALTREAARKSSAAWIVDDLTPGSANITVRGVPQDVSDIPIVSKAIYDYGRLGKALQHGERLHFADRVVSEAREIVGLLNGSITWVRFETADEEATILSPSIDALSLPSHRHAYGAVRGRIQTLTNRKGWRFTLYDSVFDRAVSCYLNPEQEDLMRGAWGRRATVEGWISRDPLSGRPVSIRKITGVHALDDARPGDYVRAAGVLRPYLAEGDIPAEEMIRRIRDAG